MTSASLRADGKRVGEGRGAEEMRFRFLAEPRGTRLARDGMGIVRT